MIEYVIKWVISIFEKSINDVMFGVGVSYIGILWIFLLVKEKIEVRS